MARIRKGIAYRKLERPYTRKSKFRELSFIRANPAIKIVRFDMGNPKKKYRYTLDLISKAGLQIRDNALESARQSSNKLLEKKAGTSNYFLKLRAYPHHILRENPLAAGAGADRFSTGMSHSFGKPIGTAAQIKKGHTIMSLSVDKENIETAKMALKRASYKLPCSYYIVVNENKQ